MSTTADALPSECPHRPPCPGCPRWGERGLSLETERRLQRCAERLGVDLPPTHEGAVAGYRGRSRLAVRGSTRRPLIGIFERGTHRVVDVRQCAVHHPLVNEVAEAVRAAISSTSTTVYQEDAHVGVVRYLQVVVERSTASAQVVIVGNCQTSLGLSDLFDDLKRRLQGRLHSLWFNGQPEPANHILGPHWEHICGDSAVQESIGGAQIFFPPGAFGQANLNLADEIVARVVSWVQPGHPIVELYAGVGAIGLGLLKAGHRVFFNEVSHDSLAGLQLGIQHLDSGARGRAKVLEGPAEEVVSGVSLNEAQVIVDPPRRGLHERVLQSLVNSSPRSVTYVSCGLASFERDSAALVDAGFRCLEFRVFDLFPLTEHVETLAHFARA